MNKYDYTEAEQQFNNVLNYQDKTLKEISPLDVERVESSISDSEELLRKLGYGDQIDKIEIKKEKINIKIQSWEELCAEAENVVGNQCEIESLFTDEELKTNEEAILSLNSEFNNIYKLDEIDYAICAFAGILAAAIDMLLINFPQKGVKGLGEQPLSSYIREMFDKKYNTKEIIDLSKSPKAKVSFDAQDNRHTEVYVDGLSTYYHRLLSLGHDPLLGLVVGVKDIMNGTMTTIDKKGNVVTQIVEGYESRKEERFIKALEKELCHLKTDVATSAGLPAPLMGIFNIFQSGSFFDEKQTIAEIVQGMYYEGYDAIHNLSMNIPVFVGELTVRLLYTFKGLKEGKSIKESLAFSTDRNKHPKLATMLFLANSLATAANAGKVYFTGNPVAINYPQWVAFANYSYSQLKWTLLEKPEKRSQYVLGVIDNELQDAYIDIDITFNNLV